MAERAPAPLLVTMRMCGLTGPSWSAWTTLGKVMEAAPLDRDEQALFERCTHRTRVPTERPAETWVIKPRRTGGSRFGGAVGIDAARKSYPLAPGERAIISCIAVDRSQAKVLHGYSTTVFREQADLRGLAQPRSMFQALRAMVTRETAWQIDLRHGTSLEVHTADFRRIRGRTVAACVADEAAFWTDTETGANPASQIFQAVRPALTTLAGRLLVVTTPWMKAGPVWETFEKYHGRDDDRILVWRPPDARTMNPLLDQRMIDDAIARDPEAGASEWGAQFRDDVAGLLTREAVGAVVIHGRTDDLPPLVDVDYVTFIDAASGSGTDSMTCAVAHVEQEADGRLIAVIDCVREARPPFDPEQKVREYAALARRFGGVRMWGDRFAKGFVDAAVARAGLEYVPSELTRSELYLALLALINARSVELPANERLVSQLVGLQRRLGSAGREQVDHPTHGGAHDDLANAVAGAATLVHRFASAGPREPAKLW